MSLEKDYDSIVVTVKGWDGSRILGSFTSLDKARLAIKEYITNLQNVDLLKDEVMIDFLRHDQTSNTMTVEFTKEEDMSNVDITLRYHDHK